MKKKSKKNKPVKVYCYQCDSDFGIMLRNDVPSECPSCHSVDFWDKPEKERQLFLLQKEFIDSNRDPLILDKMYKPLYDYARIILLKKIKNRKILTKERIHEAVIHAVGKILIYLLDDKYDNWTVGDSWFGALNWAVVDALFNKKLQKHQKMASLNQLLSSDNNSTEMLDYIEKTGYTTIYVDDERDIQKKIINSDDHLLDEIMNIITDNIKLINKKYDDKVGFLVLICLQGFAKQLDDLSMSKLYDYCAFEVETESKKVIEIIRDYIKLEQEIG